VGPQEVPELEVREHPPSTLRNALTTGPRKVPKLEVQMLETWMAGPLGMLTASPTAVTTKVEDIDGESPGGTAGMFSSGHH
jgi:hypothetical protein